MTIVLAIVSICILMWENISCFSISRSSDVTTFQESRPELLLNFRSSAERKWQDGAGGAVERCCGESASRWDSAGEANAAISIEIWLHRGPGAHHRFSSHRGGFGRRGGGSRAWSQVLFLVPATCSWEQRPDRVSRDETGQIQSLMSPTTYI